MPAPSHGGVSAVPGGGGQFSDLGPAVTAEASRRSKIIEGFPVMPGQGLLLGLPYHQIELVALRVGERGLADSRHARRKCLGREFDLVPPPMAAAP
jgi:hypothetical protein